MAEINNENVNNTKYIANIQKLENFVMVKFENDSMVQPVDSEWFGFYKPGQSVEVESLQESALYTEVMWSIILFFGACNVYLQFTCVLINKNNVDGIFSKSSMLDFNEIKWIHNY